MYGLSQTRDKLHFILLSRQLIQHDNGTAVHYVAIRCVSEYVWRRISTSFRKDIHQLFIGCSSCQ